MSRVEIVRDGVDLGVIDETQGTIKLTEEGQRRMLTNAGKAKGKGKSGDADDNLPPWLKKGAKKGQKASAYPPKGSGKAK